MRSTTPEQGSTDPIEITFIYFPSCPSWVAANAALAEAAAAENVDLHIRYVSVSKPEEADLVGMSGSPTIRIGGVDPLGGDDGPTGLACRVTPDGRRGVPSVAEMRAALRR